MVECQWSNITDPHSGISEFTITILHEDLLVFNTTTTGILYSHCLFSHKASETHRLSIFFVGTEASVKTPPLYLNVNYMYEATLQATNGAGLTRLVETSFGLYNIDTLEYEGVVSVLTNYGRTENGSGVLEEPELLASIGDYVCVLETDVLSIEFTTPPDSQSIDSDR